MDLEAFEQHFRAAFPDLEGSAVLLALSGGADSTALLPPLAPFCSRTQADGDARAPRLSGERG